jgi:hypothetical protein
MNTALIYAEESVRVALLISLELWNGETVTFEEEKT